MRKLIFVISSFLLVGCSAKWHVDKAVKKDPSIVKNIEIVDTIKLTSVFLDTIYTSDSTYYIERREVHYDTIVKYNYQKYDFSEMKSWFQVLSDNKTERVKIRNGRKENQTQIKQDNKTDRTQIRQDAKTERGGSWWWLWLSLGIIAGVFILKAISKAMDNLKA